MAYSLWIGIKKLITSMIIGALAYGMTYLAQLQTTLPDQWQWIAVAALGVFTMAWNYVRHYNEPDKK